MKVVRKRIPELGVELEQLQCGPVVVTCVPDMVNVAWPSKAIFGELSSDDLKKAEAVSPAGTVDAEGGTVRLSFNCYVIETPEYIALIDGGIGDGKERPHRPAWHRRETPFLNVLAALGVTPKRSTSSSTRICMPTMSAGTPGETATIGGRPSRTRATSSQKTSLTIGLPSIGPIRAGRRCTALLPTASCPSSKRLDMKRSRPRLRSLPA